MEPQCGAVELVSMTAKRNSAPFSMTYWAASWEFGALCSEPRRLGENRLVGAQYGRFSSIIDRDFDHR